MNVYLWDIIKIFLTALVGGGLTGLILNIIKIRKICKKNKEKKLAEKAIKRSEEKGKNSNEEMEATFNSLPNKKKKRKIRRKQIIIIGIIAVVLLALGTGLWFLNNNGSAPPLITFSPNNGIRIYDNFITVDVTSGSTDDKYDYFISTTSSTLWNSPDFRGTTNTTYTFYNLKAETSYYIGVADYGKNDETLISSCYKYITTKKLQNLQIYEIYDRTADIKPDYETIPVNTSDTIYFKARFYPNPDYLARFDVNNDGVVDNNDIVALQEYVSNGTTNSIPNSPTEYNYTGLSPETTTIIREM